MLYLLTTILYPDNLAEYKGYEDYFYSRRAWFFGLFALTFVFDFIDTAMKGKEHLESFGLEYWIRAPVYVVLAGIAMCDPQQGLPLDLRRGESRLSGLLRDADVHDAGLGLTGREARYR